MTEPTDDRLREALRGWDPARRVPQQRSMAALDEVRRQIRRHSVGRPPAWPWAVVAAIAVVSLTLVLFSHIVPPVEPPAAGAPAGSTVAAQQVLLVGSNGVRVYWTVARPTAAQPRSDTTGRIP